LTAATIAKALPVLPLVASTMVSPGSRRPSASARSTMCLAMRALIEPEGLRYSHLANTPSSSSSGVSPMASRMLLETPGLRMHVYRRGGAAQYRARPGRRC